MGGDGGENFGEFSLHGFSLGKCLEVLPLGVIPRGQSFHQCRVRCVARRLVSF